MLVPWGYLGYRRGLFSTVGDIMINVGDILNTVGVFSTVGDIMSTVGEFSGISGEFIISNVGDVQCCGVNSVFCSGG